MVFDFQLLLFIIVAAAFSNTVKAQPTSTPYEVKTCVVNFVGESCLTDLLPVANPIRYQTQPVTNPNACEDTVGQRGSLSFVDIALPTNQVLYVEVTTNVEGQENVGIDNFHVRPSRLTEPWGTPSVEFNLASFYIADTGQFSVEFASSDIWKDLQRAQNFDALMLFVNPPMDPIPSDAVLIEEDIAQFDNVGGGQLARTLGAGKYYFSAAQTYDWGQDVVYHVMDDTEVYFEQNSYVKARIIQTKQKVNNVLIRGYGVLDNAYPPTEYDIPGESDDGSRQAIHILGKNIEISGLSIVNTLKECGEFGYALNINANWAPVAVSPADSLGVFEAGELQNGNPPYKARPAHCQDFNMDDTQNTDFTNCPTSQNDGAKVSFVKAISWQMGQDGINAGKYGTVTDSFVRVVDDALKPWDSGAHYERITVWQLGLGWPINLGWWGWTQDDVGTSVENVYLIHNQNWMTSNDWPTTNSGQCVVGGVYGSSSVKSNYRIHNIFVETACSCAVGLEINKAAFSRHLTPEGCVGSIKNMSITNMFFDEEFFTGGATRTNNFLRGERNPGSLCTGDFEGKISDLTISGDVNGRALSMSDFIVPRKFVGTVPNLVFESVTVDPPSTTTSTSTTSTTSSTTTTTTELPPTTTTTTTTSTTTPITTTTTTTTSTSTTATSTPSNKVRVKIVIETPYDPTKVSWKVKIGSTNIVTGKASTMTSTNSGYETFVDLDAGIRYKFVVIDNNTIKDTFWEVLRGSNVLVDGDCNCRKEVKYFTL
mmetsp:Transcript_11164/g.16791  ORF Transcript_11164/g.16791 Transcript_11164/m.16791 type:complete len:766 (-) Transcript_11164:110-2407(-)